MCEKTLQYQITNKTFTEQGAVNIDPKCNGFVIKNIGTTQVLYEGYYIQPGDSFSVGGNRNELFVGRVFMSFVVQSPAPVIISNMAVVTQKVYVNVELP